MTQRFLRRSALVFMLVAMSLTLTGCSEVLDGVLKFVKSVVTTVKDIFSKVSSTVKTVKDAVNTGKDVAKTVKDITSGKSSVGSGSKKGEGMPPPDDEVDDSGSSSPKGTASKTGTGTGSKTGLTEKDADSGMSGDLDAKIAASKKNVDAKIQDLKNLLKTDLPSGAKLEIEKVLSGMEFLKSQLTDLGDQSPEAETASELERLQGEFGDCEKYFNGLVASAKAAVETIENVAAGAEKVVKTVKTWVDRLTGGGASGTSEPSTQDLEKDAGKMRTYLEYWIEKTATIIKERRTEISKFPPEKKEQAKELSGMLDECEALRKEYQDLLSSLEKCGFSEKELKSAKARLDGINEKWLEIKARYDKTLEEAGGTSASQPADRYKAACKLLRDACDKTAAMKKDQLSPAQINDLTRIASRIQDLEKEPQPKMLDEKGNVNPRFTELHSLLKQFTQINAATRISDSDISYAAQFWNMDRTDKIDPRNVSKKDIDNLVQNGYLGKAPEFWSELHQTTAKGAKGIE